MELTLKRLLEHAEFKKYRGKGYDPTEVDDFLDRAAAMAGKVEVQLTQALEQAKAAGSGAAPASGPSEADIEAEVERRVADRLAKAPTAPSEEESAEEVRRTLVMAQRTADAAVREAREDAERIVSAANEQAASVVADAESRAATLTADAESFRDTTRQQVEEEAATERRQARQRLAAEIAELEGMRESLRSDVNVLERHVEEQRSQLGSTLAELQQILDDPSGFRMAPPPPLNDPDLPDFTDLTDPGPAPEPDADPPAPADTALEVPAEEPAAEAPPAEDVGAEDPVAAEAADDEPVVEDATAGEPADEPEAIDLTDDAAGDPPAPAAITFDEIDHEAPGIAEPVDPGPPTAPIDVVDLAAEEPPARSVADDDDAFLAELRKAMADDEPLGPRGEAHPPQPDTLFEDEDRRGWRFGRRG